MAIVRAESSGSRRGISDFDTTACTAAERANPSTRAQRISHVIPNAMFSAWASAPSTLMDASRARVRLKVLPEYPESASRSRRAIHRWRRRDRSPVVGEPCDLARDHPTDGSHELLRLFFWVARASVTADQAVADVTVQEPQADLVQRGSDGVDLGHDVDAVAIIFATPRTCPSILARRSIS